MITTIVDGGVDTSNHDRGLDCRLAVGERLRRTLPHSRCPFSLVNATIVAVSQAISRPDADPPRRSPASFTVDPRQTSSPKVSRSASGAATVESFRSVRAAALHDRGAAGRTGRDKPRG